MVLVSNHTNAAEPLPRPQLCTELRASPARRIRGLGPRQRECLLALRSGLTAGGAWPWRSQPKGRRSDAVPGPPGRVANWRLPLARPDSSRAGGRRVGVVQAQAQVWPPPLASQQVRCSSWVVALCSAYRNLCTGCLIESVNESPSRSVSRRVDPLAGR